MGITLCGHRIDFVLTFLFRSSKFNTICLCLTMPHSDLLLDLPSELSGEIVGRWLRVEEIARLDTAFCQTAARECLHRSVLTSSSCIIAKVGYSFIKGLRSTQMLNWVAGRSIRAEHVDVRGKNDLISNQYLQTYRKHIKSVCLTVCLTETYFDIGTPTILIARYCGNLQSVDYSAYYLSDSVLQLLNACPGIRSLKIYTLANSLPHLKPEPKINSLRVHSLDIDCERVATERILNMCVPEAVQRLRLSRNWCVSDWSRFRSLRSLDLRNGILTRQSLMHILDQCRSLVNLHVAPNGSFDSELSNHMPPLRSLNIENGCMDRESQLLCSRFVQKQKQTLEALYVCGCAGVTGDAINLVLVECLLLRTLSIDLRHTVDFSLMGNLTTLIMDFADGDDWSLIQQHCRNLQYLHVIFECVVVRDPSVMVAALSEMPTLRVLHFAGVTASSGSACTDAANQLRVLRPTLYIEEDENEGAWYDLFKLPI